MTTTTLANASTPTSPGFSGVRTTLRLEGAALMAAAITAYALLGGSWLWFAVFLFVPDVSMLGYLVGRKVGAVGYNLGHSLLGPALLAASGFAFGMPLSLGLAALTWVAHIGMDRALGYGLKTFEGFKVTHLTPNG